MKQLPPGLHQCLADIQGVAANVEGRLTPREVRCLAWLGALPTTAGATLEIGSFRGKSTIVLARAALAANQPPIVAVDPFIYDPGSGSNGRSAGRDLPNPGRDAFWSNLKRAGVSHHVEFYETFSSEVAKGWTANRKLRLLWIDGDHTYRGAKVDFDLFKPLLAEGAIVALHDVLHRCAGPVRVFAEDMLLSPEFGAAGVCGSIGWSQYLPSTPRDSTHFQAKKKLYRQVSRLIPFTAFGKTRGRFARWAYKLARARVPRGEMHAMDFVRRVAFV